MATTVELRDPRGTKVESSEGGVRVLVGNDTLAATRVGKVSMPMLCRWYRKAGRAELKQKPVKVSESERAQRTVRHGQKGLCLHTDAVTYALSDLTPDVPIKIAARKSLAIFPPKEGEQTKTTESQAQPKTSSIVKATLAKTGGNAAWIIGAAACVGALAERPAVLLVTEDIFERLSPG